MIRAVKFVIMVVHVSLTELVYVHLVIADIVVPIVLKILKIKFLI